MTTSMIGIVGGFKYILSIHIAISYIVQSKALEIEIGQKSSVQNSTIMFLLDKFLSSKINMILKWILQQCSGNTPC
jgi:hypothetical protein